MTNKQEKFILCPVCEGRGTTVNPNIDANGLTNEDFAEDPDMAKSYFSGAYDIVCRCCDGQRVTTKKRLAELRENAAARKLAARENGDFEDYSVAGDYRYG